MHPNDGRVVSNFIIQALQNQPITIYGDGAQTRSFCFVDDLIEGFIRFMDSDSGVTGPINLGNPQEMTMIALAEEIIEISGSKSKIDFMPLPSDDPRQRRPDISNAKELLAWTPKVSTREGLAQTVRYFNSLLEKAHGR